MTYEELRRWLEAVNRRAQAMQDSCREVCYQCDAIRERLAKQLVQQQKIDQQLRVDNCTQ